MKKFTVLLLTAILALSLTACGGTDADTGATKSRTGGYETILVNG